MKWEKFIQAGFRMPFYMNLYIEGLRLDVPKLTGWNTGDWLVISDHQLTSAYHNPEALSNLRRLLKKNISNKAFFEKFPRALMRADEELLRFSRLLYYKDYEKVTKKELEALLKRFAALFRAKFGLYALPKMTELAMEEIFPETLSVKLSDEDYRTLIDFDEPSGFTRARAALLLIAENIKFLNLELLFSKSDKDIIEESGRFYPALYFQIECYVREFAWVPVKHHVQPKTLEQALADIRETLKDKSAHEELEHLLSKSKQLTERRGALLKKYKFSRNDLSLIGFMRKINEINESRKAAMSQSLLWSYPLFQALADYLGTDVVSLRQLNSVEILDALEDGAFSSKYKKISSERLEYYVCVSKGGRVMEYGKKAAIAYVQKEFPEEKKDIKEFRGMVAQKGKATGKVRLILMEHQVENLQEGEILVTSMTDPDMVPAMKKAAAIVTDEGGVICHAAIASREFKKPCVIGTKIATKVLKNGDLVEVDATEGKVTILSRIK